MAQQSALMSVSVLSCGVEADLSAACLLQGPGPGHGPPLRALTGIKKERLQLVLAILGKHMRMQACLRMCCTCAAPKGLCG